MSDSAIVRAAIEAAARYGIDDPDAFARRVLAARDRRRERATRNVRTCSTCGEQLPALSFAVDPCQPDGLRRVCKPCDNARRAAARRVHITQAD